MNDSIGTLFFKDKQVKLILVLSNSAKEWHLSDLAKEANVTYIHTSKFISKCEAYGLITTEKHGRTKRLLLTEKGKEMAKSISAMLEKIKAPLPPTQTAQQTPFQPQPPKATQPQPAAKPAPAPAKAP